MSSLLDRTIDHEEEDVPCSLANSFAFSTMPVPSSETTTTTKRQKTFSLGEPPNKPCGRIMKQSKKKYTHTHNNTWDALESSSSPTLRSLLRGPRRATGPFFWTSSWCYFFFGGGAHHHDGRVKSGTHDFVPPAAIHPRRPPFPPL